MKALGKIVLISLVCYGATFGNCVANLITFDDLTGGGPLGSFPAVPNGYGGLNWNNFDVADVAQFSPGYGYYLSAVSGNNVAFNPYGDPASISRSAGTFNLYSVYLTFALNLSTPLYIQVEGFLGSTMLYDNTYVVYDSGPSFIDLNYDGVNDVKFLPSPSQQFAMDNLDVSLPDSSSTVLLLGIGLAGMLVLRQKMELVWQGTR